MKNRDTLIFLRELSSYNGNKKKICKHIFHKITEEQSVASVIQLVRYIDETLHTTDTVVSISVDEEVMMFSAKMLLEFKTYANQLLLLNELVCLQNNPSEMEMLLDNLNATIEGDEFVKGFANFLQICENNNLTKLIKTTVFESIHRPAMSDKELRTYLSSIKRSEAAKLNFLNHWSIGSDALMKRIDRILGIMKAELEQHICSGVTRKKSRGVVVVGLYKSDNSKADSRASLLESYNCVLDLRNSLNELMKRQVTSYLR